MVDLGNLLSVCFQVKNAQVRIIIDDILHEEYVVCFLSQSARRARSRRVCILQEKHNVSNVMHPVPTLLRRGGEIHPMHLYGTNVVWIKSNEANGNNKELILRLNQPLSARAQSFRETDQTFFSVSGT